MPELLRVLHEKDIRGGYKLRRSNALQAQNSKPELPPPRQLSYRKPGTEQHHKFQPPAVIHELQNARETLEVTLIDTLDTFIPEEDLEDLRELLLDAQRQLNDSWRK